LNAGLLGVLIPGIGMAVGVTQAVALSGGIVRYLGPLYRFKDAGAGAADATAVPSWAAIQDLYAFHLLASVNLAATWIVVATLHAAVVRWWRARREAELAKEPSAVA